MINIEISDLKPAGSDLFADAESFLTELQDTDAIQICGAGGKHNEPAPVYTPANNGGQILFSGGDGKNNGNFFYTNGGGGGNQILFSSGNGKKSKNNGVFFYTNGGGSSSGYQP